MKVHRYKWSIGEARLESADSEAADKAIEALAKAGYKAYAEAAVN